MVVFALILYIGFLLDTAVNSPEGILYITLRCRAMLDYALLTTVILIGGSLFVDCVIKGKNKVKASALQFLTKENYSLVKFAEQMLLMIRQKLSYNRYLKFNI